MRNFSLKQFFRRTETYILIVLIVLSIVLAFANPKFLTLENIFDLLRNNSFLGILALGELVVLISGGIDVSFTAIATVSQYVMGVIISKYFIDNILVALLLPIPIGIALGAINAVIINYTKVHPVIITISNLNVFYGLLIFITGGKWIYKFPPSFRNFARLKLITLVNERGIEYGLSIFTGFWILIAIVTWLILKYLSIGRKIYAVGGNMEAARRVGFNIFKVQLFVYCYIGALSGIASFVQAQLSQIIQPNAIVGRELDVLAAAILGGASVFGGSGTVIGTVWGVLLIGVIKNGLILMKIPAYWHQVVLGLIIAIAAGVTAYQRKLRKKKGLI